MHAPYYSDEGGRFRLKRMICLVVGILITVAIPAYSQPQKIGGGSGPVRTTVKQCDDLEEDLEIKLQASIKIHEQCMESHGVHSTVSDVTTPTCTVNDCQPKHSSVFQAEESKRRWVGQCRSDIDSTR